MSAWAGWMVDRRVALHTAANAQIVAPVACVGILSISRKYWEPDLWSGL